MALKLIERHYHFNKPGTQSDKVDVGGKIISNQGIAVLRGIEPSFNDDEDHQLLRFKAIITNIKTRESSIEYDIEFDFRDEDDNVGSANIDLLIIADVQP